MAGHLLTAGFAATVYNRRREKAEPLLAKGALWAPSPKAVAEASDVDIYLRDWARNRDLPYHPRVVRIASLAALVERLAAAAPPQP